MRLSSIATLTLRTVQRSAVTYDRVIVLDRGDVVEDGKPSELLTKDDGVFNAMCLASGEYDQLSMLARGQTSFMASDS